MADSVLIAFVPVIDVCFSLLSHCCTCCLRIVKFLGSHCLKIACCHTAVLAACELLNFWVLIVSKQHAALQDVAPEDAGKLLGITNTCGTVVGIIGNILTGNIAASQWGYPAVFALISASYLSSFAVWRMWVKGHNIVLGKHEENISKA